MGFIGNPKSGTGGGGTVDLTARSEILQVKNAVDELKGSDLKDVSITDTVLTITRTDDTTTDIDLVDFSIASKTEFDDLVAAVGSNNVQGAIEILDARIDAFGTINADDVMTATTTDNSPALISAFELKKTVEQLGSGSPLDNSWVNMGHENFDQAGTTSFQQLENWRHGHENFTSLANGGEAEIGTGRLVNPGSTIEAPTTRIDGTAAQEGDYFQVQLAADGTITLTGVEETSTFTGLAGSTHAWSFLGGDWVDLDPELDSESKPFVSLTNGDTLEAGRYYRAASGSYQTPENPEDGDWFWMENTSPVVSFPGGHLSYVTIVGPLRIPQGVTIPGVNVVPAMGFFVHYDASISAWRAANDAKLEVNLNNTHSGMELRTNSEYEIDGSTPNMYFVLPEMEVNSLIVRLASNSQYPIEIRQYDTAGAQVLRSESSEMSNSFIIGPENAGEDIKISGGGNRWRYYRPWIVTSTNQSYQHSSITEQALNTRLNIYPVGSDLNAHIPPDYVQGGEYRVGVYNGETPDKIVGVRAYVSNGVAGAGAAWQEVRNNGWIYSTDGMNATNGDKIIVQPDHVVNFPSTGDLESVSLAPSTGNWRDIAEGDGSFNPDADWTFGDNQIFLFGSDVITTISNLSSKNWLLLSGSTLATED